MTTQPPRTSADGAIEVHRHPVDDNALVIRVTHNGTEQSITVGGFNAWRLFGMLSLLLGIPLPKRIGKAIQMGDGMEAGVGYPPPQTLGEKMAQNLVMKELESAGLVKRKT